jgi:hypothetical protein
LALTAEEDWEGKILFDQPRHRLILRLPVNYLRLNEWSEWFTVDGDRRYRVTIDNARSQTKSGAELAQGLSLQVQVAKVRRVSIRLE